MRTYEGLMSEITQLQERINRWRVKSEILLRGDNVLEFEKSQELILRMESELEMLWGEMDSVSFRNNPNGYK